MLKIKQRKSQSPKLGSAPQPHGKVISRLRHQIGFTQPEFSRLTGYSVRSIADWESGKPLSMPARKAIQELDRLQEGLARVMKPDFVADWLRAPNPSFEGQTPLQVIERGESDRIWRMIWQLEANVAI